MSRKRPALEETAMRLIRVIFGFLPYLIPEWTDLCYF
jgi:hypothetical protein